MNAIASAAATGRFVAASSLPTVGGDVARGALWTLLFSILSKGVTVASQIALAWFLLPEHFGLVAMTLAVMSFTAVVGGGNLKNILVQRSDRFREEAGQVFWLALILNLAAAFVLVAFSPLAGLLFHEPRVVPLLLVAAVALPFQSICTIYVAALHRDLRFERIALIQFGASLLQNSCAVLLAWQGCGAYSLVLPLIASALFMALAFRHASGRISLGRLQFHCLRNLQAPALWLIANALFAAIQNAGVYVVIGLVHSNAAIAGFYYWGFALSSQAVFLLVTNLQGVLFPALSKLNHETLRQFAAVETGCRVLTAAIAPVCLLQALLAAPLIEFFFHDRWRPAIPVVQWVSLGMVTQPLNLLAASVLLARGQFQRLASLSGCVSLSVLAAAVAGAMLGHQAQIACWTGCTLLVANLMAGWIAYREFGRGWSRLLAAVLPSLVPCALAALLGWWAGEVTARYGILVQIIAVTAVCLSSWILFIRLVAPQLMDDVVLRVKAVIRFPFAPRDPPSATQGIEA